MDYPKQELVAVLSTSDELAIGLARSLLEDAGIPFYVTGEELGARPGMADAFLYGWHRVMVPRNREPEARELLKHLRVSGSGEPR